MTPFLPLILLLVVYSHSPLKASTSIPLEEGEKETSLSKVSFIYKEPIFSYKLPLPFSYLPNEISLIIAHSDKEGLFLLSKTCANWRAYWKDSLQEIKVSLKTLFKETATGFEMADTLTKDNAFLKARYFLGEFKDKLRFVLDFKIQKKNLKKLQAQTNLFIPAGIQYLPSHLIQTAFSKDRFEIYPRFLVCDTSEYEWIFTQNLLLVDIFRS